MASRTFLMMGTPRLERPREFGPSKRPTLTGFKSGVFGKSKMPGQMLSASDQTTQPLLIILNAD
jgi:hypothetical protein